VEAVVKYPRTRSGNAGLWTPVVPRFARKLGVFDEQSPPPMKWAAATPAAGTAAAAAEACPAAAAARPWWACVGWTGGFGTLYT